MVPGVLTQAMLEQLTTISTEQDMRSRLADIAAMLDFDSFLYGGIFSLGKQKSILKIVSGYPAEWRLKYDAENYIQIDPVMQHCSARLVPIAWGDLACTSRQQHEFMEEAGAYGLVSGISFPIHSKQGDIGVLSFARRVRQTTGPADAQRAMLTLAQGVLVAAFMHDVMTRIVNKQENVLRAPLTRRELECLKWIAIGKSTWEISSILGISEHGVLYHVRNIMLKFDAQTRHVAVLKAIACGLV
ncbi:LuxR family transcriptional regulator MalR [Paraburkholderia jirisanensis]